MFIGEDQAYYEAGYRDGVASKRQPVSSLAVTAIVISLATLALNILTWFEQYEIEKDQQTFRNEQRILWADQQLYRDEQRSLWDEQRELWRKNEERFKPRLEYLFDAHEDESGHFVMTFKNESSVACGITYYQFIVEDYHLLNRIDDIVPRPVSSVPWEVRMERPPSLQTASEIPSFNDGNWTENAFVFSASANENLAAGSIGQLRFSISGEKWKPLSGELFGRLVIYYDKFELLVVPSVTMNVL